MKFKYFLFLFFFTYNLFYTQSDSLKKYSFQELQDKFYTTVPNNTNKASVYAKYFIKKAKLEQKKTEIADGYVMMQFTGDLQNGLKYIDSLKNITQGEKDYPPSRIFLLRGNLYFKFDNKKGALNNYILALKNAREIGNKRHIAKAEINIAYLNNFIGKHGETVKVLKYYLDNSDFFNDEEHHNIKLNLADAYIEVNKIDSANALIKSGLQDAIKSKNTYRYNQFLILSGFLNLKSKNYKVALNDLLQTKKYFFTTDDQRNRSYSLLYLGYSYDGLNQKENAIKTFTELDSITSKTNYHFPELRGVYTYLIDYYKEKKDKEKQLYFIERFLDVDHGLDAQFRYVSRELPRRYDSPQLVREKEEIISHLENRKIILYVSISILLLVLLIVIYLYNRSKKAEKRYQKIAKDLIESIENNKNQPIADIAINKVNVQVVDKVEIKPSSTKNIPTEVTDLILKELEIFETKEHFLKKGITLITLAKTIKTNSSYLSEVINTNKGKNFATYLNDLRIDYALKRLVQDKKFRSYKLSVIADELGYNNEQAFSLAFKKKTGTTLTIYLKEIDKANN